MEGLDLGQTSNPSLAWKMDVLKINDDDEPISTLLFSLIFSLFVLIMTFIMFVNNCMFLIVAAQRICLAA